MRAAPFFAVILLALSCASAYALPTVQVTQVVLNNDDARVYFLPFPGAADYRAYTLDNPKEVKYAGIIHLFAPDGQHWTMRDSQPTFPYRTSPNGDGTAGPSRLDVPALNIEVNGLDPGVAVKLVVEAVDHIGPSPYSNLATEGNMAVSATSKASNAGMSMTMDSSPMELLGSNAGPTDDGLYSINGQSGPHVIPRPIGRSIPVTVTPTGRNALPSTPQAEQVVYDTFGKGSIEEIPGTRSDEAGNVSYLMHTDQAWRIDFLNDDIYHSRPFIMNRHYMDVLFDGSTPSTGLPLHIAHGAMTMAPVKTADFSDGRVLHVTMEVDAHLDGRRWVAFNLSPWNDPIENLYFINRQINKSNTALFVQFFNDDITTDLFEGSRHDALAGALGQGERTAARPIDNGYNGRGLDNRSRFDLFLTRTKYAVFEDGKLIIDQDFHAPLPASLLHVRVYYTHYLYHTGNEIQEVNRYAPYEHFWTTLFPYSDERHWDNMGFEVLPASFASDTDDQFARLILDSRNIRVEQAVDLAQR
jgi:hypothetical protein